MNPYWNGKKSAAIKTTLPHFIPTVPKAIEYEYNTQIESISTFTLYPIMPDKLNSSF